MTYFLVVCASVFLPSWCWSFDESPIKVIVIDPGHGGEDTGAIGPSGLEEKDLTLAIAKRLARILKDRLDCRVLLTRSKDVYISLEERTAFANKNRADLFISIHANAARRKGARGVETYFLSFEASDDEARMVAAFENNMVGIDGRVSDGKIDDIKAILWDLVQTEAHHQSASLAESIHTSILRVTGGENRGVKQAPFIVLAGATMPSVLVEVGFITNPIEEKRLSRRSFQKKIAEAISDGVLRFERRLKERAGYVELREGR